MRRDRRAGAPANLPARHGAGQPGGRESRVEYQAKAAGRWASNGQIMQFAGLVLLALAIVASVLIAVLH